MQESGGIREIANCVPTPRYYHENKITDESWYYYKVEFPHDGKAIKNTFMSSQLSTSSEFKKRLLGIAPGAVYTGTHSILEQSIRHQLFNIKRVETVDYIDYSKEHQGVEYINNTAWENARQLVGLEEVRVHDLRHTVGMRFRNAGGV